MKKTIKIKFSCLKKQNKTLWILDKLSTKTDLPKIGSMNIENMAK
jgi:hypothetical protein